MASLAMNDAEALTMIRSEEDSTVKMLLLAALVSKKFREAGFEPIIVGGSAIEFYTEGAYRSGDIDICFARTPVPSLKQRDDILAGLDIQSSSLRTMKVEGLFLDILGEVETLTAETHKSLATPIADIVLQPVEDLLVERVYIGFAAHTPNADAAECARKLMTAVIQGHLPIDWEETDKLAKSPNYDCFDHLLALRREVER